MGGCVCLGAHLMGVQLLFPSHQVSAYISLVAWKNQSQRLTSHNDRGMQISHIWWLHDSAWLAYLYIASSLTDSHYVELYTYCKLPHGSVVNACL